MTTSKANWPSSTPTGPTQSVSNSSAIVDHVGAGSCCPSVGVAPTRLGYCSVTRLSRYRPRPLLLIAVVAFGLYLMFLLYPLAYSFYLSLTNRRTLRPGNDFVGLDNYRRLGDDARLTASLKFTFQVVVFVTVVSNLVGLAFAMLLNRPSRSFRIMRTIVFIPQVLSGVIVAFIWRSMLVPSGLLNRALLDLGLVEQPVGWLGDREFATLSICVMVSWITIAFATVIYTAALQSIPPELYEAARLDGARRFKLFRHVTFPMLAPGMTISVTLSLITTFKLYDVIVVLTGGGPANSTRSTAYYLIFAAFEQGRAGYAAAISMLLLAITAGFAYGITALLRRREVAMS